MKKNPEKIVISVSFEKPPKEEISLIAFLFGRKGKLLYQAPVINNSVELSNPGLDVRELRVFIAPASDKSIQQVTSIAGLQRFKPYEPILTTNADGRVSILPIPSVISRFWPICHCRVECATYSSRLKSSTSMSWTPSPGSSFRRGPTFLRRIFSWTLRRVA